MSCIFYILHYLLNTMCQPQLRCLWTMKQKENLKCLTESFPFIFWLVKNIFSIFFNWPWPCSVLLKGRNKQNFTNFYSREFSKCYINNFISLSHSFILLHYSLFIFHIIVQDYSACTTVDKFQNSIQSNTRIWIRSPLSALFLQPFVWMLHYILFSVWF